MFLAGSGVIALDGATGTVLWQKVEDGFAGLYDSAPLVMGETLFGLSGSGDLVALAVRDGAEQWRTGLPDSTWLPSGILGAVQQLRDLGLDDCRHATGKPRHRILLSAVTGAAEA